MLLIFYYFSNTYIGGLRQNSDRNEIGITKKCIQYE